MSEETKKPAQTAEQMEAEIKTLELEAKRLEVLEKQANLQDLQERLDERQIKRENKRQRSIINGSTLKSLAQNDAAAQQRCNHKKGGNGAQGVVGGQGDDPQYAVLKHKFCNGDTWVRCLRCGKTWKPPIESDFYFDAKGNSVAPKDGKFRAEAFEEAKREYREALAYQTRNVPSGSVMFQFGDGGNYFRETMKNTNLR